MTFRDGHKYLGEVQSSVPHGRGIIVFGNGVVRLHEGLFKNGELADGRQENWDGFSTASEFVGRNWDFFQKLRSILRRSGDLD